jgi:gliding motility-associated-like protein
MKKILLLLSLLLPLWVKAAVFTIADGDVTGLITAINTANTNGEADIINLAMNGTYTLTAINFTSTNPNTSGNASQRGLPRILDDATGLDLTINGNGSTILRDAAAPNFGIFAVQGQTMINDLTIRNGNVNAQGAGIFVEFKGNLSLANCKFYDNISTFNGEGGGGAIYTKSLSVLTVTNCIFEGNQTPQNGGAISNLLSNLTILNSTFKNNKTTNTTGATAGGAVYSDGARGDNGTLIIRNSIFEGNETRAQGGGLFLFPYNNESAEVTGCIFKNNKAEAGAGFWHREGSVVIADGEYPFTNVPENTTLTFENCTFEGNIATSQGAVWLSKCLINEVKNCTFKNNTASLGGGMYLNNNRPLALRNCTFVGNIATNQGGALTAIGIAATLNMENCTFVDNTANAYGGAMTLPKNTFTINITNCTFSGNSANNPTNGQGGSIFSGGNTPANTSVTIKNCIFNNSNVTNTFGGGGTPKWRHCNCELSDGGGNLFFPEIVANAPCVPMPTIADPKLNPLADNGGATQTMSLQAGSPAINAGAGCPTTDQRGVARVGACDIGAFEFGGAVCNLVVSSNADAGANTLREAINCATSGQTITFAPSMANQTITLTTTLEIPVNKNLTIDGLAAANLTISGNNTVRVFLLKSTSVNPTTLNLKNLKVINGNTNEYGGGIKSEHQGLINLENCIFNNNKADDGGSAVFSAFEGKTTIKNCKFDSNISIANNTERGSTVMLWGPFAQTIQNSDFTNNKGINGAAINGLNAALLVENCNFLNNVTTDAFFDTGKPNDFLRGYGGAIYTDRATAGPPSTTLGSIIIRKCKFEGNIAQADGGAMNLYTDETDNVLVEECYFNNNESKTLTGGTNGGSGGAIVQMNNAKNKGFIVKNSTFSNNNAAINAGAIRADWADTQIINCTFFNNKGLLTSGTGFSANGGALAFFFMAGSSVEITNSTFANNYAGWVGGAIATSDAGNTKIKNNIFFQNTAGNGGNSWNIRQQASEHLTDLGGNIQFPDKANTDPNNRNVSTSVTITDPKLNAITNNGGFSPTISLQTGSPAINFGIIAGAPTADQTGKGRTGNPDAGAVEYVLPAVINTATTPKFTCGMTEAAIIATGATKLSFDGSDYYIGTKQTTPMNQDPIIAKFTAGTLDWCKDDYETTGADGRGVGLFYSGTALYAVFTVDGTQGMTTEDFRRFTTSGWLKTYTDGSPSGGGGPKGSVIVKIDLTTGDGMTGNGTFITALNSSTNKTNSLVIRDMYVNGSGNIEIKADSYFAPRKTNKTAMTQIGMGSSPHDYTLVLSPDLTTAVCASAVGWDNGTGTNCDGTMIPPTTTQEIQVLDGIANVPDNTGNLNWGTTTVGTPITKTFTIKNLGTSILTLGTLSALPIGFSLVGTFPTGALVGGASASFQVRLDATVANTYTGTLSFVNDDADENPFNFTITGTVNVAVIPPPPPPPTPPPVFVAPPITISLGQATENQISISWNLIPNVAQYSIERRIFGTNNFERIKTIENNVNSFIDINLTPAELYEYRIVALTSSQPQPTSSILTVSTIPPAPKVSDGAVCGAGNAILTAQVNSTKTVSYNWYAKENDTNALQSSNQNTFNTPVIVENSIFYVSAIFNGQESKKTPVNIIVKPMPSAKIKEGAQVAFCEKGMINAEKVEGATYRWLSADLQEISIGESLEVKFTGMYRLAVKKQDCEQISEPITVIINPLPIAKILQEEKLKFCREGIIQAQVFSNMTYEWTDDKGNILGKNPILKVTKSGIYILKVKQNACESKPAQVSVEMPPIITAPKMTANKTTICEGETLKLEMPQTEGVSYYWFNDVGFNTNSRSFEIPYRKDLQLIVYKAYMVKDGCNSDTASIEIKFSQPIDFEVKTKNPNCVGGKDGSLEILTTNEKLQVKVNNQSFSNQFIFNNLEKGEYNIIVKNEDGCEKMQKVILNDPPDFKVIASEDIKISRFVSAQLTAAGAVRYEWSPSIGLDNPTISNPKANPLQTTVYTVKGYNENGCVRTDEVIVTVLEIENLVLNKVLSPNNDGVNDFWQITDIEKFPDNQFMVYNRFGQKVYEASNYKNNWEGRELEEGTYYYILYLPENKQVTGIITVVR